MTTEEQYRRGEWSGRDAATQAAQFGYWAWLYRQINSCKQLSDRYPYARGYVIGALGVLADRRKS